MRGVYEVWPYITSTLPDVLLMAATCRELTAQRVVVPAGAGAAAISQRSVVTECNCGVEQTLWLCSTRSESSLLSISTRSGHICMFTEDRQSIDQCSQSGM
jgi:hypothetical protein